MGRSTNSLIWGMLATTIMSVLFMHVGDHGIDAAARNLNVASLHVLSMQLERPLRVLFVPQLDEGVARGSAGGVG
jgi:hypothetical protein